MAGIERQTHDINIYRGDTVYEALQVLDTDGSPVDITTYTQRLSQVRAHVDGPILLTLTVTPVDATQGTFTVTTSTPTGELDLGPDGVGTWDVQFSDGTAIHTAFVGTVTFTDDVSHT